MDFNEYFNNQEISDVVLKLVVKKDGWDGGPTPVPTTDSTLHHQLKRARDDETENDSQFYLHKFVLLKSKYFSAAIKRWQSEGGTTDGDSRLVLIEHVDECDLQVSVIKLGVKQKRNWSELAT